MRSSSAQLRGTPDALPCGGDVRDAEGETAKRAETGSLRSSSSPNPQSREKRANTLPEWKQIVSYRKQYHQRVMKPGAQEMPLSSQYDRSKGACTLFPGLADVLWSVGSMIQQGSRS